MVCSTSGVNAPPTAATPMIAVGLSVLIAARKSLDRRLVVRVAKLVLGEAGAILDDEAARIHQPVAPDGLGFGQPFGDHG